MKIYIECVCGGDAVAIETDEDQAFLAFWSHGHPRDHHTHWREKWRWIRAILRDGHPYCDSVVLQEDELNRLIAALQQARERVIAAAVAQAAPP